MSIPIRVLIVEDSAADAELMLANLVDHGFAPQAERVETEADFLAGLNAAPDVILSDYHLPLFSGPRALELLNGRAADIPFIALSGAIGDEQSAGLIKLGASDFLLKDRMARLGPAVTQALKLKNARDERRRLEAALAEHAVELEAANNRLHASEDRYRDLVENSQGLICMHDLEGKLLSVNMAAVRLTGYTREALLRMNMSDLLVQGARNDFAAYLNEIRTTGTAHGLMLIRTAGGETRWWEYHNTLRTQGVAEPVVRGLAQDITERKRTDEQLRQWETVFQNAGWGVVLINPSDNRLLTVNPAFAAMHGYRVDEMIGMNVADTLAPQDRLRLPEYVRIAEQTGRSTFEAVRLRKDGSQFLCLADVSFVRDPSGNALYRIANVQDITERKQAETKLARVQREHERILNSVDFGIHGIDRDGNMFFENLRAATLFGRSAQEIYGQPAHSTVHHTRADGSPYPQSECPIYATLRDGVSRRVEDDVFWRQDGTSFPVAYTTTPLYNDAGEITGTLVAFRDITERKQIQSALHKINEWLQLAVDSGGVGLWEWQIADDRLILNDRLKSILGLSPDVTEPTLEKFLELIHPQDISRTERALRMALENHAEFNHEYRILWPDGTVRWIVATGRGSYSAANQPLRMVGAALDITSQKQSEAALREGEETLRLFVEHSPAAICMLDNDMRYLVVSRRWLTDYGLSDRDLIGRSHYEIFPEIPRHWKDIHRRCLAGATEHCDEDPFVRADGRTDWVKWEVCPWHKADGEVGGIVMFTEMVTERKQTLEALRENSRQLQAMSIRVLEAQETERRRLAGELHDELGQSLTAIKINLQARGRLKDQSLAKLDAENIRIVEETLQQVRRLALALRPSMLDDLGLGPALRWMAGQQAGRGGFVVHFGADISDTRLAPEIETACFRIAQEALTNITRHAQAKRVTIDLHHEDGMLHLIVQDDGCGFDTSEAYERAKAGGSTGVLGMQERAALTGGRLEFETTPGCGTTVRAHLPWRAREENS